MGVPFLNILLIFLVYQILHSGSVSGLPFASISSIPSLKTAETLPSDETPLTSSTTSSLVNSDLLSSPVQGTLSSNNFQFFIGSPDVNTIFFSPLNQPLINSGKNDQISSVDSSNVNLLTSLNVQSSFVPSNPASESGLSINSDSNILSQVTSTPTLTSGLSIVPTLNADLNSSNFKRELRDTISVSQESYISNTISPLSSQTGFLSPFSNVPSFANLKPIIPCVACRLPVNFTQSPTQDNLIAVECNSQESNKFSNVINCDVPSRSLPVLTNVRPCITPLQNNLLPSQENSNTGTFNSFTNRNIVPNCAANKFNILQDTSSLCSCESCEVINVEQPSISPVNTLSSFAALKNYVKSRQNLQPCLNSDAIQNQPNIEINAHPSQCSQVNNNLMLAQALQNNKLLSQQSPSQTLINNQPNNIVQDSQNSIAECENKVNQHDRLTAEYENILRIRNNVIPQMLSNNVRVKNIPQNNIQTNNDNSGCPQLETVSVENDVPYVQSNNLILNSGNICGFANNNLGSNGYISLNNIARMIKDNRENNNNCVSQNNNNQGCPQLMSIPIYNKESLLNKQFIRLSRPNNECSQNQNDNCDQALTLPNNNINFNNNILPLNQDNQGCPQLLALAKNNLCNQNCNSQELSANVNFNNNYNCIQAPAPNDNLAQALKLKNLVKNQPSLVPEATINILPFGQTLLDGKPIPNNFISLDSTGPMQLSSCTDSCNSNNFLSIQDVSAMPFSSTPLNQFSCVAPLDTSATIPTNIMLAPSFSPINSVSPITTSIVPSVINLAASVPNIASITATESTIVNQPLVYNPGSFCNNNIQPTFTLLDNNFNCPLTSSTTLSGISPLLSSDSVFIQSLPQVSFINNIPSSTLNDNCISSLSNLPPVCTSIQPVISPTYFNPLITALPQCNSVSDMSVVFPSLNNVVSSLTQNIISTLITKALPSTGAPLSNLPPVNPFSSTVVTDSSINSPICLDSSEPVQYVSAPLSLPRLSLPDIPVACNEYLPPVYNSAILPLSFNSELFCVESDSTFDTCSPFALSKTDAYYPEISFVVPTVGSSDCSRLRGPLFMPASSLPKSSPVLKINSTGREAKGFEQLISTLVF